MNREVNDCPDRRWVGEDGSGHSECHLLQRVSGVEDGRLCAVRRDACESCCQESAPSDARLNPTVASLLFRLAADVSARDGVPGCDRDRAARLRARAVEELGFGGSGGPIDRRARHPDAARVGLIGWNTPSGLGHLNRDLARRFAIDRWLIPAHPVLRELPGSVPCRVFRSTDRAGVLKFLGGLDWLVFCECPYVHAIARTARTLGVRVACVAMWEYCDEGDDWLPDLDLVLCPTRFCRERVLRLRERLGLSWEVAYVPWPIDLDRFPFRPRSICRAFLFVNGIGGGRAAGRPGPSWDGRKGVRIVAEAARLAPTVPIVVRSQTSDLPDFPDNVTVRLADLAEPSALYHEGDVRIQPSRWEGLGLSLLECQASGLPLITTDAPPMNEYRPHRVLPSVTAQVRLVRDRTIPVHDADPVALARVLRAVHGSDVSEASLSARRFVESEHSWESAAPRLRDLLVGKGAR